MTDILTAAELAEIERLNAARTQGEWEIEDGQHVWNDAEPELADCEQSYDGVFIAAAANNMGRLLSTIDAMRAALEAWAHWCLSPDGAGGGLFDNAIELTARAGVDMEGDEE